MNDTASRTPMREVGVLPAEATRRITEALEQFLAYKPDQLSLTEILASTFEELENRAPHVAIRVTTGTGKTLLTLRPLARWIEERKALGLDHRVLILVPTHELSGEMSARARNDARLDAAVFRGRNASRPESPSRKMCSDLTAVQDALKVGADVASSVCGPATEHKPHCPFRFECAWWDQIAEAEAADVLIAAHEFLYFGLPREVGKGFGLVIVDEAFWQNGLELPSRESKRAFQIDGFTNAIEAGGSLNASEANRLREIAAKAESALNATWKEEVRIARAIGRAVNDVPLSANPISAVLTVAEVSEALRLEQRRCVPPKLLPGMPQVERTLAVRHAAINAAVRLRREFWFSLREMLLSNSDGTGRIVLGLDGERLSVTLLGRRRVRQNLWGLPILHLDATLRLEVLQVFLPRMRLAVDCDVDAAHQQITQVRGRSGSGAREDGNWSRQYLDPKKTENERERRRRTKRLRKIETLGRIQRAGLVTHKDLLEFFPRIELKANFNATRGIDKFRDAPALFVVGRPLPRSEDLLAIARALTAKPIRAAAPRWQNGKLFHAEPEIDLVHRAVTEAEVMQAIGRARGVRRGSNNSVVVWLFVSDMDLPLRVDEVVRWEDIEPDVFDEMEAEGLVLESAADIVKIFPDIARDDDGKPVSEASVRQWLRRGRVRRGAAAAGCVTFPYRNTNRGMSHNPIRVRVRYRPAGARGGQQTRTAIVAPERLATLQSTLEGALGKLAEFEIEGLEAAVMSVLAECQGILVPAAGVGKNAAGLAVLQNKIRFLDEVFAA